MSASFSDGSSALACLGYFLPGVGLILHPVIRTTTPNHPSSILLARNDDEVEREVALLRLRMAASNITLAATLTEVPEEFQRILLDLVGMAGDIKPLNPLENSTQFDMADWVLNYFKRPSWKSLLDDVGGCCIENLNPKPFLAGLWEAAGDLNPMPFLAGLWEAAGDLNPIPFLAGLWEAAGDLNPMPFLEGLWEAFGSCSIEDLNPKPFLEALGEIGTGFEEALCSLPELFRFRGGFVIVYWY